MDGTALLFAGHQLEQSDAKTAHGLIRGSDRYQVLAVLDGPASGKDAGEFLDGQHRGIPIVPNWKVFQERFPQGADYFIIGVASVGGRLDPTWHPILMEALQQGCSLVNGLHEFLSDDPDLCQLAAEKGLQLIDVRKPKPKSAQHFWTGQIQELPCPKVAVMGTDCAIGKRTAARLLTQACQEQGHQAEMIYTGQTGWMQGGKYGFILDSTLNDFVSGELEQAMLRCWAEVQPDLMVIEGQASLRNPSGPCGAEFLVSGQVDGVFLIHSPARTYYHGWEHLGIKIPPLETDVALIEAYGVPVLGIGLNTQGLSQTEARDWQQQYHQTLKRPVVLPIEESVSEWVSMIEFD